MSNLPPGVSVWMIPGNRPEDEAWERFLGVFDKVCENERIEIPEESYDADWFMRCLSIAADLAYNEGYADGLNEAEIRRAEEMNPDD